MSRHLKYKKPVTVKIQAIEIFKEGMDIFKILPQIVLLALLSYSNPTLAQSNEPDLSEAKKVLEQSVLLGKLNFVVAALGNANGQTWSHAAGL